MLVEKGETVFEGDALMFVAASGDSGGAAHVATDLDLDHIRADLAELLARHAQLTDAARPDAVARRRKTGQRTTRVSLICATQTVSSNMAGWRSPPSGSGVQSTN